MKKVILLCSLMFWLIGGCSPNSNSNQSNLNTQRPSTQSSVIPQGTKVDDLDLSGTQVNEVSAKIEDWAKDKLEESRILLYNGTEVPITLKELGFDLDTEKTVENTLQSPQKVTASVLKAEPSVAVQVLEEKLKKFNKPPQNATYKIQGDKVVITPAQNGSKVAVDQFISNLQKNSLAEVPQKIEVPLAEVPAAVSTESLKALAFDSVIGEYSTKFSTGEVNRTENLTAAAKALNGKVIKPGGTFSFNQAVGPREAENGYKQAYVIINGEYVKGTGGGVCQVSSTLYNAVLLSNLKVAERVPHDVAVTYVPAGQDATVNYPNIDFKFQNNTGSLVYLKSDVKPGVLTIKLYGKKNGQTVRIERQVEKVTKYKTIRRYDASLPKGRIKVEQTGTNGTIVSVYKVIQDNGSVTKQLVGRDSYAPANRILKVGT
ncbi:putative vancomycin resistance protein [Desulfosporosinus acidiphilus SJ4]|uniref:Putative vancomycin resistance protein n=1 Tax=Desulfosporosinus acidiphilus (strain DSM 22704 / JCM 16185 / SJ4) TaxID=646529 RepID=I4D962_DESAJ|nr:VanW family protein [Desulfosporosinus acidiphilus]AFM42336.1 putative vancomycin resistance protein [Desulfosporosinus acidiphilus SJ4]